jgi:hypothetical protein
MVVPCVVATVYGEVLPLRIDRRLFRPGDPQQMKPYLVAALAAIISVAALAACGSGGGANGSNTEAPEGTVVGNRAQPGQFPWMASTQLGDGAPCGGAVIAPTWVLTGKHCHGNALTDNPDRWQVRVGSVDRTQGGEVADVKDFVDYPDDNVDLALIQLERPVSVVPLPLVAANESAPFQVGASAITLGWGTDGESKRAAKILDWNPEVTADNSTCDGGQDGVFCGGRPGNQGSGTCMFDSGAPYVWAAKGFASDGTPLSTPYVAGTLRGLNNETCGIPGQNDDWQSVGGSYGDWIRQQVASG